MVYPQAFELAESEFARFRPIGSWDTTLLFSGLNQETKNGTGVFWGAASSRIYNRGILPGVACRDLKLIVSASVQQYPSTVPRAGGQNLDKNRFSNLRSTRRASGRRFVSLRHSRVVKEYQNSGRKRWLPSAIPHHGHGISQAN